MVKAMKKVKVKCVPVVSVSRRVAGQGRWAVASPKASREISEDKLGFGSTAPRWSSTILCVIQLVGRVGDWSLSLFLAYFPEWSRITSFWNLPCKLLATRVYEGRWGPYPKKIKPWFVVPANFYGINIPTKASFKLQMWCGWAWGWEEGMPLALVSCNRLVLAHHPSPGFLNMLFTGTHAFLGLPNASLSSKSLICGALAASLILGVSGQNKDIQLRDLEIL